MFGRKILIIMQYTFKELLKSKVLYITGSIGVLLIAAVYVATEFTYGTPQKVAVDLGLGLLSYSSLAISMFLGVTLLSNEIDSRTVYMIISRPVPRWVFITGKLLGLIIIQLLNLLILSLMTYVCLKFLGGELNQTIFYAVVFNLLESILLLLLVVFLSLFCNTVLATFISFVALLAGHGIREAIDTSVVQNNPLVRTLLEVYHFLLPGFYKLNLKDYVTYDQNLPYTYLMNSSLYGILYSGFLFLLIILIFNKKNLD